MTDLWMAELPNSLLGLLKAKPRSLAVSMEFSVHGPLFSAKPR